MFSYEPSGLEVKRRAIIGQNKAGLPYLCMVSSRTDITFSDVAESKTYPVMKRDASSSYATSCFQAHLESLMVCQSTCHRELGCSRSYWTHFLRVFLRGCSTDKPFSSIILCGCGLSLCRMSCICMTPGMLHWSRIACGMPDYLYLVPTDWFGRSARQPYSPTQLAVSVIGPDLLDPSYQDLLYCSNVCVFYTIFFAFYYPGYLGFVQFDHWYSMKVTDPIVWIQYSLY